MKKIATLFLTLLVSFSMFAVVSQKEKEALIKLHHATSGTQWKVKWDLAAPVATWYGVSLQDDKVIAVVLQNNNLIGQLPQEILNLVHLQELDLHKNQLTGTIPSFIGKLKEMKVLNLSFNRLTGTIPSSICDMSKLKDLQLYMNAITGELPAQIGALKQLETLSLLTTS